MTLIRPIFLYAQDEEQLEVVPNFRKLTIEEIPRDRVLDSTEIRDVWRAAERIGYPYGHLVRILLLTAQRRGEVAGMTWDEITSEGWRVPSDRSKNGIGHLVPITDLAQSVLDECPQLGDYVFAGWHQVERDGEVVTEACPIAGFSKFKRKLDRLIVEIRREDAEAARMSADDVKAVPNWTLHDLRRTAATGMQSQGFSDEVVDRVLNHVLPGVRRTYNRFSRDPEKRLALNAWAAWLHEVIEGNAAPSNVVKLEADSA